MDSSKSLYEGHLVCLGPIDHEKDPEVIARWTHDPLFAVVVSEAARPLSTEAVKKMLEKVEKKMEETRNLFHFTLRARAEEKRLVGVAKLHRLDFHSGTGNLALGIGDVNDRRHGFGSDALHLLLRFAFGELNLHRIGVWPTADNIPMMHMVEKAGFEEEARRREASFHNGEYWDVVHMGLLREKWETKL